MRVVFMVFVAAAGLTLPLGAQERPAGEPRPLPDHWLTWDSVTAGLDLGDEQLLDFAAHYEQLNAVMGAAAAERLRLRERFRAGGARESAGPPSGEMREQMQAARRTLDSLQAAVDGHYAAMRDVLTAAQRTRFDRLAKPRVLPERRPGMRRPE